MTCTYPNCMTTGGCSGLCNQKPAAPQPPMTEVDQCPHCAGTGDVSEKGRIERCLAREGTGTIQPADEWAKVVARLTHERDEAREENERLKEEIKWLQNDLAGRTGTAKNALNDCSYWQKVATAAEARVKALEGDAAILLAQLDALQEATGYRLEGEDAALVDGIRASLKGGE